MLPNPPPPCHALVITTTAMKKMVANTKKIGRQKKTRTTDETAAPAIRVHRKYFTGAHPLPEFFLPEAASVGGLVVSAPRVAASGAGPSNSAPICFSVVSTDRLRAS